MILRVAVAVLAMSSLTTAPVLACGAGSTLVRVSPTGEKTTIFVRCSMPRDPAKLAARQKANEAELAEAARKAPSKP